MLDQLNQLYDDALAALKTIEAKAGLDDWYARTIGRKGTVTLLVRRVGELPKEERPAFGRRANEAKRALEAAYEAQTQQVKAAELAASLRQGAIDVTLPGRSLQTGRLHPSTQTLREVYAIFAEMGFQVYRSPDVESDEFNFQLLNMPPHHPARDMWDTFYTTEEGVILRTHTSPGQIRAMRDFCPEPIRVILPGMCYRYEQISARAEIQFYQVEGLAVGHRITMTDLKGTMADFARRLYGEGRRMRFRSSHFPFTEPSVEVDMDCILCRGKGCAVCKYTGWLEIAGAGMVHPVVLHNGGYDPNIYSGFAFGMGPERVTMLKHDIKDIRQFWANDLRFLEQF
ncbi:MAG: phenylalanine--tRNA ligase subunit alpha [Anaerolineae bacterium]|jgi:phenylalanyl-tRNA synthetase alpha chain